MPLPLQLQNFIGQPRLRISKLEGKIHIDGKDYPITLRLPQQYGTTLDPQQEVVNQLVRFTFSFLATVFLVAFLASKNNPLKGSPSDFLKEVKVSSSEPQLVGLPNQTQQDLDRCFKLFLSTLKVENMPEGHTFSKNLLFVGPPGNGKTQYIKKLAAQHNNLKCFTLDGTRIMDMYVGTGPRNLESSFKEIRKHALVGKVCVFIDEFEALAPKRNVTTSTSTQENTKVVDKLLTELNDLPSNVLLIAATNCPNMLDDAVIRAGRFDMTIEFPEPDKNAMQSIFQHYLNRFFPHSPIIEESLVKLLDDLLRIKEKVGEKAISFSSADIESGIKDLFNAKVAEATESSDKVDGSRFHITVEELLAKFQALIEFKRKQKTSFI